MQPDACFATSCAQCTLYNGAAAHFQAADWQADIEVALQGMTTETEQGRMFTLSVGAADEHLEVQEVGCIAPADFRRLYTVSCFSFTAACASRGSEFSLSSY